MQLLGGLSADEFLHGYWQKKPLLIRQAIPGFTTPLSPDELAGLACEDEVESRLILEKDATTPWQLEHGPFTAARLSQLPASHWTLLIQKANQLIPELAELLDRFNFIPNWRIDDVMVSYAPESGSVGPHVDQYDVFLLQGLGTRRWQINTDDSSQIPLLKNTPLQILQEFTPQQDWLLEPGDMLYLPPNVAHYGIAQEDCMTFSIGFRAPRFSELLTAWTDEHAPQLPDQLHYQDPELQVATHNGEIATSALEKVRAIVRQQYVDDRDINRWFGQYITEPPAGQLLSEAESQLNREQFRSSLGKYSELWRSEFSRFAFIRDDNVVRLYVDGQEFELETEHLELVALLCDQRRYKTDDMQTHLTGSETFELLTALYNMGAVEFPDNA